MPSKTQTELLSRQLRNIERERHIINMLANSFTSVSYAEIKYKSAHTKLRPSIGKLLKAGIIDVTLIREMTYFSIYNAEKAQQHLNNLYRQESQIKRLLEGVSC